MGKFRPVIKRKAATAESLLYQARNSISRVAKIVRLHLVRRNIRIEDNKKKTSIDELKGVSCQEITEAVMPIIEGAMPWASLNYKDPSTEAVLKHRKIKEAVDFWASKVSAAKIKNSVEKNDNVQVKSESVLIKPGSKQISTFVESLAQNEPQLTNSSKNGKAWKDKKRKLLLLTKRHAMSSDLNHSRDTSHLSSLVSIQVEKDKNSFETLHPSWAAKKLAKDKIAYTLSIPEGKKTIFDQND